MIRCHYYRQENDVGRLHGIFRRKKNSAVVDAAFELRLGRPANCEVPLEQVVLERLCEVLRRGRGQLLRLAHQALHP